jgi:MraZ protein
VAFEHLFSGSAVGAVGADGTVPLPPFITNALSGAVAGRRLIVGAHDRDPCLKAYAPAHRRVLLAEIERRRLQDEAAGVPAADHHRRARRMFGFVEETGVDSEGRLALPALMRKKGRIGGTVLFVGTGESFEIWDPDTALEAGDDSLREIAAYRFGSGQEEDER